MRTARLSQQVPPHRIQAVKEATDLAALVSEYVELKKAGPRLIGRCVFHEEKTASFGVNPKGFYFCFGCGAKGDALSFLQRIEGISFHEALKRLAERTGVSLDGQPVSRMALRYAREEATMAQWWWGRRRGAVMAIGCRELAAEAPDIQFLDAAYRIRGWIDAQCAGMDRWIRMTSDELFCVAAYQHFREHVKSEERAEYRTEQEYEAAWAKAWLSLATLPVVAHVGQ